MTIPNKTTLLQTIRNLLETSAIETQEDMCKALAKRGIEINQAMVSRILHKLGAVKMNEGDKVVYRLPTAEFAPVTPKNSLSQLILSIDSNENLIVINTAPGSAQLVASLLDQHKKMGILGTVAGDNTIFIAPKSVKEIQSLRQKISNILLK